MNINRLKKYDKMLLYVDGSWNSYHPEYSGWGYTLIHKNKILYQDYGKIKCKSRQIDGELYATLKGLEKVKELNLKKITIVYDYIGIQKWFQGEWKAKSDVSKNYVTNLEKFKSINVIFSKVKSHSGECKWNDYVDNLAKKGLSD